MSLEWHGGTNPCPYYKPYLMEQGYCDGCPAFGTCMADECRSSWQANMDAEEENGQCDNQEAAS